MSQTLGPLWAAYMQGNRGFVVVHSVLLRKASPRHVVHRAVERRLVEG